ncbi:MAG TPA: serine hydrolase domain-containing protein, partial [Pyrinomonadaceae bacterium]|nr:serine hydrolase domain-containing protein [Pyrinomonadaceae bacterium]
MVKKAAKVILSLLVVSSSFGADYTSAQTRKRASSQQVVAKGAVGNKANELLTRYAMYGLSGTVLIVQNDQIVFQRAFGLADIERKRPNTLNTVYDAGSIAKTFTATAILQLESAGKLKTGDAISKYLGEFPSDKATITIHHLLSHTAGLKLDPQDVGINPITAPDDFLKKVKEAPLLSPPGEKYSYSNLGYGLLAIIIEKVSGENWHAYVRKNILKPAGLSQTMLYGDTSEKLAHGYLGNDDEDLQLEEPLRLARPDSYVWRKYAIGAGGIFSTTGDLYKWWRALHSRKVLSDEARRKMFSLQATEQGYGWNIQNRPGGVERTYRGGLRGSFQSMLGYYPKQNTLLIYALNKNVANAQWASVLWTNLEKLITGKPHVVPPAILTANPANMDRYAGNYVLPSGDGFTIWREKNSLMIGAIGQSAVNLVAYPEQVPPSFQNEVGDLGKEVIAALIKGDSSKLTSGLLTEKDASALRTKWESWMNAIGGLRSYQLLGVSPGSGGNPRAFIKLNGEKSSLVVRLLFNWSEKRLIAWGDNITMPAIAKLRPQSDTSFVNFDFQTSRT